MEYFHRRTKTAAVAAALKKTQPKPNRTWRREGKKKSTEEQSSHHKHQFFPISVRIMWNVWKGVRARPVLLARTLCVDEANLKLPPHRVTITYSVRLAIWILNLTRSFHALRSLARSPGFPFRDWGIAKKEDICEFISVAAKPEEPVLISRSQINQWRRRPLGIRLCVTFYSHSTTATAWKCLFEPQIQKPRCRSTSQQNKHSLIYLSRGSAWWRHLCRYSKKNAHTHNNTRSTANKCHGVYTFFGVCFFSWMDEFSVCMGNVCFCSAIYYILDNAQKSS